MSLSPFFRMAGLFRGSSLRALYSDFYFPFFRFNPMYRVHPCKFPLSAFPITAFLRPVLFCLMLLVSVFGANAADPAKTARPAATFAPASNSDELAAIIARVAANQTNAAAKTNIAPPPPVPAASVVAPVTQVSTNTDATALTPLDDKRKLAIGDRLSFRIVEDEEDPKPLIVTDSGELEVPYIGRVPAVDKTCKQLAAEIKGLLEKDYYYEATVTLAVDLMAKTRGRIYLVGAVRAPGPQEILTDETLTLSKAILRSGGFADFADKKNVKITRKTGQNETDKQTFIVNVGEIFDKSKTELDVPLQPGDMILVPDRKIRF